MTNSAQWFGWEEAPKHFPKPNLHQKKVLVTVWWSATGLIHYSFLTPAWWNHYIWEVSSANRWATPKDATPASTIGQQSGSSSSPWQCPIAHHTTNASKVEWIRPQSFALSTIFTWPLINWLPLLQASQQLFAGKTFQQPAGSRKCFPRVHWILKHGFLHYRNKLVSHWQKYVDCNGSYFD